MTERILGKPDIKLSSQDRVIGVVKPDSSPRPVLDPKIAAYVAEANKIVERYPHAKWDPSKGLY